MGNNSLAMKIRKLIDSGMSIDCISIICDESKEDILDILQEHYTEKRAQNLWLKSISNHNFNAFIDESIKERFFLKLEGKTIAYSSMIAGGVYAKKLIRKKTGIFNIDNFKNYIEYFSETEWCIVAEKASNELGLVFGIFGPNAQGEMEIKSVDDIPAQLINQFIRKAYNTFDRP